MQEREWISEALMWMSFCETEQRWIHNPPAYPEWTLPPNHGVPASHFIRIWQSASTINAVKKELFWCSLDDIEHQRERINDFLLANHYQILPPLEMASTAILSDSQLAELEAEGLIQAQERPHEISNRVDQAAREISADDEVYDAARAIFDAVPDQGYQPHSHIASVEVHGGRFRGRH